MDIDDATHPYVNHVALTALQNLPGLNKNESTPPDIIIRNEFHQVFVMAQVEKANAYLQQVHLDVPDDKLRRLCVFEQEQYTELEALNYPERRAWFVQALQYYADHLPTKASAMAAPVPASPMVSGALSRGRLRRGPTSHARPCRNRQPGGCCEPRRKTLRQLPGAGRGDTNAP